MIMTKYNHCDFETNATSKLETTHFKNHLKACREKQKVDIHQ